MKLSRQREHALKAWLTPGLYKPYSEESRAILDRAIDWSIIDGYFRREAYVEMEQYVHSLVVEGLNEIVKKSLGHD